MTKGKKNEELEQHINELTKDVQRVRADFENYRKRVELEKEMARASGRVNAIMKLLPVIDNIERAIGHVPKELSDNSWAQGVAKLVKNLEKSLSDLHVTRINASPGTVFDPELHEAIQYDDNGEGHEHVIAEELQAGYKLGDEVIRHALVRVKS